LKNRLAESQLWKITLGYNFGEQRRGTALGSSFGQHSGLALRQLRVATLEFWGVVFLITYIFVFSWLARLGLVFS